MHLLPSRFGLAAFLLLTVGLSIQAQVPGIITYQGRVTSHDTNFTGQGQFKFALVAPFGLNALWSQDGKDIPITTVSIPVINGLFSVALGDTSIPGMEKAIPTSVFGSAHVYLRIWFNDGLSGLAQLKPDQRLTSVGYALRAASVVDGAITSDAIAPGAITGAQIAKNSLDSSDIADVLTLQTLNLGGISWDGNLNLFAKPSGGGGLVNPSGEPRGVMVGDALGSELGLFFSDGKVGAALSSRSTGGKLLLKDSDGGDTTVELGAGGNAGGFLALRNPSGLTRTFLHAGGVNDGGELQLRDNTGANRLRLYGNAPGFIIDSPSAGGVDLFDLTGNRRIALRGGDGTVHLPQQNGKSGVFIAGQALGGSGGVLSMSDGAGDETIKLLGSESSGKGSLLTMRNGLGDATVSLDADGTGRGSSLALFNGTNKASVLLSGDSGGSGVLQLRNNQGFTRAELDGLGASGGGELVLKDENGTTTVLIEGAEGPGNGGQIALYNGAGGTPTIILDADQGGEGRITTQVIEITGGSDLSENFDIQSPHAEPGMLVRIDPSHPGELIVSDRAYDRTVAGVVSGAGGVRPGMLMGQRHSKADGKHPVALSGRVYCFADARAGAIEPGDLITTSSTPGYGMKATDPQRSQGAIIGKAMTGLTHGQGLVLILVSLQ